MKRTAAALLCLLLVTGLCATAARADMGPKPSVAVDFYGLAGEQYYVTLLSKSPSTGPYSVLTDSNREWAQSREGDANYDVFMKFVDYQDPDGFYFLQYFQNCTESRTFLWTYYPPSTFKVLLYFPETGRFQSSEITERYAFDSYFTADVSDAGGVSLTRSYNYTMEILSLAARVLLTIAAELAVALLFALRDREALRFIALVNLATQLALNVALNVINYQMGQLAFVAFYVLLEIVVFAVEGSVYAACLTRRSTKVVPRAKAWLYALTANAVSFALGLWLAHLIPGIF